MKKIIVTGGEGYIGVLGLINIFETVAGKPVPKALTDAWRWQNNLGGIEV